MRQLPFAVAAMQDGQESGSALDQEPSRELHRRAAPQSRLRPTSTASGAADWEEVDWEKAEEQGEGAFITLRVQVAVSGEDVILVRGLITHASPK